MRYVALLALALLTFGGVATAQQVTLTVVGSDGLPVPGYRWLLEEDVNYEHLPGVVTNDMLALKFHKSHMPAVAKGTQPVAGSTQIPVNPAKRYFISVLPTAPGTYTIGGAAVAKNQTAVTVTL